MKKIIVLTLFCISSTLFAQENTEYLIPFSEERGGVHYFGYKYNDGETVIKAKYRVADTDKMYRMAIVLRDDGQWVGIDREDNIILYPFIYDNGPDYVFEGLFRIVENDKIGFADLNGNIVIAPEFDFAERFKDGLAEFAYGGHKEYDHINEHWSWTGTAETGFVNRHGQRFMRITNTHDGKRIAWTKNGKGFFINEKGKIIKEYEPKKQEDE